MGQEFSSLLHSSLSCAGQEVVTGQVMRFIADTMAHGLLGVIAGVLVLLRDFDIRWAWAGLALIAAKELVFDMPNGGWSALVVFDSIWDLGTYVVAFVWMWWALMADRKGAA